MKPIPELLAVVDAATPGSWNNPDDSCMQADVDTFDIGLVPYFWATGPEVRDREQAEKDAEFIRTFDPPTVRALLEELAVLRRLRDAGYRAVDQDGDHSCWHCGEEQEYPEDEGESHSADCPYALSRSCERCGGLCKLSDAHFALEESGG